MIEASILMYSFLIGTNGGSGQAVVCLTDVLSIIFVYLNGSAYSSPSLHGVDVVCPVLSSSNG